MFNQRNQKIENRLKNHDKVKVKLERFEANWKDEIIGYRIISTFGTIVLRELELMCEELGLIVSRFLDEDFENHDVETIRLYVNDAINHDDDIFSKSPNVRRNLEYFIAKDIELLRNEDISYFPFELEIGEIHEMVYTISVDLIPSFCIVADSFSKYSRQVNEIMEEIFKIIEGLRNRIPLEGHCEMCPPE